MKVNGTFEAKRGLPSGAVCSGKKCRFHIRKGIIHKVTFWKNYHRKSDSFLLYKIYKKICSKRIKNAIIEM